MSWNLLHEAMKTRPDHLPEYVLAGANWPMRTAMEIVIEFSHPVRPMPNPAVGRNLPAFAIVRNDPPDADSVLVWDDGGHTIMRYSTDPQFDVRPENLGLADPSSQICREASS